MITKHVSVYNDGEGWIARCTEFDAYGPVLGRIAMDEPMEYAETAEDAAESAAEHYGVEVEDVELPS